MNLDWTNRPLRDGKTVITAIAGAGWSVGRDAASTLRLKQSSTGAEAQSTRPQFLCFTR
jgi:hypothetical protein